MESGDRTPREETEGGQQSDHARQDDPAVDPTEAAEPREHADDPVEAAEPREHADGPVEDAEPREHADGPVEDAEPREHDDGPTEAAEPREHADDPDAPRETQARGASLPGPLLSSTPESFEMEFKGGRKAIFENPRNIPFRAGDHAIVEVERGQDIGLIIREGQEASKKLQDKGIQGPILRRATADDIAKREELSEKEAEAHRICQQCIARQSLPMKLVDVEWQFDGNKIRFFFTSDRRVDFRKLVRDLASIFKTRIEMRQIGVRDEARRLGGFGRCGRYYCCRGVISDFDPVTLKMVKEQHLAPGSPKISGGCGRLMCCLRYERGLYAEAKKEFPKVGAKGTIEGEQFKVIGTDIFKRTVTLGRKDADPVTVALKDFKKGRLNPVSDDEEEEFAENYWDAAEKMLEDE